MVNYTQILSEILIYSSYYDVTSELTVKGLKRIWKYKETENHLLSCLTVLKIERDFKGNLVGYLFDYSNVLNKKITSENCLNFFNACDIKQWDIHDKELTLSKYKEILKNNAILANAISKISKQLEEYKKINTMFK